jgi:hypothetical protein
MGLGKSAHASRGRFEGNNEKVNVYSGVPFGELSHLFSELNVNEYMLTEYKPNKTIYSCCMVVNSNFSRWNVQQVKPRKLTGGCAKINWKVMVKPVNNPNITDITAKLMEREHSLKRPAILLSSLSSFPSPFYWRPLKPPTPTAKPNRLNRLNRLNQQRETASPFS